MQWTTKVPGDPLGGATVVNDLVFTATVRRARSSRSTGPTGEIVWQRDAPGGINGWMSVAGDLLVVPVGNADPPRLVAYRLTPIADRRRSSLVALLVLTMLSR